jgi:membrane fusion protein, copper/silver efflux system
MKGTNNKRKIYTVVSVAALLMIAALALYNFGSSIPILNEISFFKQAKMEEKDSTKNGEDMAGMQGHNHGMMGMPTKRDNGGESKSAFMVSPERQQLIGVKMEPVLVRYLEKEIRTVGTVEIDETRIENVNTKIKGWIDKVFIDYTWQYVKKGDQLFSIYSPELVSTQEEFLLALKSKELLGNNQYSEIARGSNSLLEATRRRLELWDISENQIRELERTGEVKRSLIINSPVSGNVVEKNAFENMFVEPNTTIYIIADLSVIWVHVDIYENEIPLIKLDQQAAMTLASFPGEEFTGRVTFVWPYIDPKTRTVKVRLEFPNPNLKLLPGMYANVNMKVPIGERLSIPKSAVLRTGKQDVVFVDKGEGKMEIRKIELGLKVGDYYEVLRGLKETDRVVSRANFLIDSESKIQAAVATWGEETESDQGTMQKLELNPDQEKDDNSEPKQRKLHNH